MVSADIQNRRNDFMNLDGVIHVPGRNDETEEDKVLNRVLYMNVPVRDQDKALDFYTNVLGLEMRVDNPTPDGPRFLTVGVKDDAFALMLWPGAPGRAEPAFGTPPPALTFETDDCRATFDELRSRGVEFVSDVREFPTRIVAQFVDPDGNLLQIREARSQATGEGPA